MKVYVVTEGSDHEGASIHGVFSTREKAQAYKDTMPVNEFWWYTRESPNVAVPSDMNVIHEMELDVPEERGGISV